MDLPWEELKKGVNKDGQEFRMLPFSLTMKFEGEPKFRLVGGNTATEQEINVIYKDVSP